MLIQRSLPLPDPELLLNGQRSKTLRSVSASARAGGHQSWTLPCPLPWLPVHVMKRHAPRLVEGKYILSNSYWQDIFLVYLLSENVSILDRFFISINQFHFNISRAKHFSNTQKTSNKEVIHITQKK